MENLSSDEPTVEELVAKALAANVIDEEFAEDLRGSTDLEEALGMFYTYITEESHHDPTDLLQQRNIIDPTD